jgi:hypothetical protein
VRPGDVIIDPRKTEYAPGACIYDKELRDLERKRPIKQLLVVNGKMTLITSTLILELMAEVIKSIAQRSVVWTFAKSLPEPPGQDETQEVIEETLTKEFSAAIIPFSTRGLFDWHELYNTLSRPLAPPWENQIRRIVKNFCHKINRFRPLLPTTSSTKNVSQHTALLYNDFISKPIHEVTTQDLEVLYGHTGNQVQGPCELRQAWKFNDLKPRFYYARGGKSHFASRYIKPFAIALMDSLPVTETNRRRRPTDYLAADEEDFLVTWDFSAFTTNLSELKYFLYHVAEALRDQPVYDVRLVDYHLGMIRVHPSDLLHDYNEAINLQDSFSIHRVAKFFLDEDVGITFEQQNSGMLGVPGNIGFSTACHGAVIATVVDTDKSVCVGDDGEAADPDDPDDILIPTISRLGSINRTKFQIVAPYDEGPMKFMKRGLWREKHHLSTNILITLPTPAYVDGITGNRTIPPDFSLKARYKKTVIAVGSLLWSIRLNEMDLDEKDLALFRLYMDEIYNLMHLPYGGALRNHALIPGTTDTVDAFVPPLPDKNTYDIRKDDWEEFLFDANMDEHMMLPVLTEEFQIPCPMEGDSVYVSDSRYWRVLEAMGYVKRTKIRERRKLDDEQNRRRAKNVIKGKPRGYHDLVRLDTLATIPEKFSFMFCDPHYPRGFEEAYAEM